MPSSSPETPIIRGLVRVPQPVLPWFVEYAFYALVLYAIIAEAWGISVPLVGAGGRAVLASYCVWRLRGNLGSVYSPLFLVLCCAVTFLLIQFLFYDESIMSSANREIINWIFTLIIVQSLLLCEGFFHRFTFATAIIGAVLIPYLIDNYSNASAASVQRAGLDRSVGVANPDDLAAWFGFCCVFFMIVSIETKRYLIRIASFFIAIACLGVVGLTVTRAALIGIAIALVIALRRLLKRGFLPVLFLAALVSAVLVSGLFDQAITSFGERGTEDTGRLVMWPVAIGRFFDSPFIGVGANEIGTYVPQTGQEITPHNVFLYVALMSGIIPLTFFVWYWFKAIKGAYELSSKGVQDAPFQLPLIIYTLIQGFFLAGLFMSPWAIVVLCNAVPRQVAQFVMVGIRRRSAAGFSQRHGHSAHATPRNVNPVR